jgi:hypothetical protein
MSALVVVSICQSWCVLEHPSVNRKVSRFEFLVLSSPECPCGHEADPG